MTFLKSKADASIQIKQCIADIQPWMLCIKLEFDDNKTKFLQFLRDHKHHCSDIQNGKEIGSATIEISCDAGILEGIFDAILDLSNHLTSIW